MNFSWGFFNLRGPRRYAYALRKVFYDAYMLGVTSVAAIGNGTPPAYDQRAYPAAYGAVPEEVEDVPKAGIVITVGGVDARNYRMQGYENSAGDPIGSRIGSHIDVVAPGGTWPTQEGSPAVGIWSTVLDQQYDRMAGTSMSAPHVAGLAGLMLSVNPHLSNDDIRQIIRLSADRDLPEFPRNAVWCPELGTGRVNARRAVSYCQMPYRLTGCIDPGWTLGSESDWFIMDMPTVPKDPGQRTWRAKRQVVYTNTNLSGRNIIGVWG